MSEGKSNTEIMEGIINQSLKTISAQAARIAALERALELVASFLADWSATYAPEECSDENVARTRRRITANGGTLAHIAHANDVIRAALQTTPPQEE